MGLKDEGDVGNREVVGEEDKGPNALIPNPLALFPLFTEFCLDILPGPGPSSVKTPDPGRLLPPPFDSEVAESAGDGGAGRDDDR